MPWDPPDIPDDPDEITERILDGIGTRLPGWVPVEGAPEVAIAEELGREVAVLNQTTSEVLALAIAAVGETGFGFPAYLGAAAALDVALEVNAPGDVIPAGFTVVGLNTNGDEISFELADETVAQTTTVEVTMTATEEGDAGNQVPADDLVIVTATTTVVSATALTPSRDGADPEPLEDYLTRLVAYLGTLRPGGVTPTDIAALARSVPGVHRALAVDLYDPTQPDVEVERTVTVFPVDETNAPVSPTIAARVAELLQEAREVNFNIYVDEPTYTPVNIVFHAVAEDGADPEVVRASINGAIVAWLDTFGSTTADPQAWRPISVVRLLQLARVAGSATGVAYIETLTINGQDQDFPLDGVAPLPAPVGTGPTNSTVTGTVE